MSASITEISSQRGFTHTTLGRNDSENFHVSLCNRLDELKKQQKNAIDFLYLPTHRFHHLCKWWLERDSNSRPQHYECCALTG